MTTHDRWEPLISDYMDSRLARSERRELEAHVETCPECRATLAAFREIRRQARELEPAAAPSDPWPSIAGEIASRRRTAAPGASGPASGPHPGAGREAPGWARRWNPGWAAAAAVTLAVAAAGVWVGIRSGAAGAADGGTPPGAPSPAASVPGIVPARAVADDTSYARRVRDLEDVFVRARAGMDPATLAVIEESLRMIDDALNQAEAALSADPENDLLRALIERSREQKLDLLADAARSL